MIIAGDALAPATRDPRLQRRDSRRVLIVMSGRMFGWWFGSLIFDYPAYQKALVDFAEVIRGTREPVHVVLKSHPVSDLHELYDKMVNQHPDVFKQHQKESMSEDGSPSTMSRSCSVLLPLHSRVDPGSGSGGRRTGALTESGKIS